MRRTFVSLLIAPLALGFAAVAPAAFAEEINIHRVSVAYADLDLSHPGDARSLYLRLTRAANEACDFAPRTYYAPARECREAALNAAVAEVAHPALTAIHRGGASEISPQLAQLR